jgi:hypothetical protein
MPVLPSGSYPEPALGTRRILMGQTTNVEYESFGHAPRIGVILLTTEGPKTACERERRSYAMRRVE